MFCVAEYYWGGAGQISTGKRLKTAAPLRASFRGINRPGDGNSSVISMRRPCNDKAFAHFLLREKVWRRESEPKGAAW